MPTPDPATAVNFDSDIASGFMQFIHSNPDGFNVPKEHRAPTKEPAIVVEHLRDSSEEVHVPTETEHAEPTAEESEVDSNEDGDTEEDDGLVTHQLPGNKSVRVPKEVSDFLNDRQYDYTKKTQAISQEKQLIDKHRNELAAEQQAVQSERAAHKQHIEILAQAIGQAKAKEPNWEQLLNENPTEFVRQRYLFDELKKGEAQLVQQYQQIQAKEHQEYLTRLQEHNRQQHSQLISWNKSWADPKVLAKDMRDTANYAIANLGATEADFANATDSKVLYMAYKAMLQDRNEKASESIQSKAVKSKTLAPGSTGQFSANKKGSIAKDIDSLRKMGRSPSDDALASVMAKMLKS